MTNEKQDRRVEKMGPVEQSLRGAAKYLCHYGVGTGWWPTVKASEMLSPEAGAILWHLSHHVGDHGLPTVDAWSEAIEAAEALGL